MDPATLALTGQASCLAALRRVVQSGGFGHAVLLASADAVAVEAVAQWCAAMIACTAGKDAPCGTCAGCASLQRQDGLVLFHLTLGDKPTYAVADLRAVRSHLALRAGQPGRRVVRIDNVECCTVAAANALLKVLEEPGADVTFILTTASLNRVLPTVRSRAMLYRLQPVPRAAMAQALAGNGLPPAAVAAALDAAPGQLGQAAALAASAESLAGLRAADTLAASLPAQSPTSRFRALADYMDFKQDVAVQRQQARMLLAACARRVATDPWVRQRLSRLLSGLQDLQTNSQPRFILEAFVA